MSYGSRWEWWEFGWLVVMLTACLLAIMGVAYAIWGPHTPPDPKTEYINSCEQREGIPDTHTSNWQCTEVQR